MKHKVVIIGGGFSGLVLLCGLLENKIDALLLERNDRVGKKILATGNGRGNVTNAAMSTGCYHGNAPSFCDHAIKTYDNRHIEGFFNKKGVLFLTENGRVYPASLQANAILDSLRLYCKPESIRLNTFVKGLTFDKKQGAFKVETSTGIVYGEKVVLAAGGKASPHFGTDGNGYALAGAFGHKTTPLYPSLVQLLCDPQAVKGLKGVKQTAKVSVLSAGKEVASMTGDVLFSDHGVSGNTVFYLSAYVTGHDDRQLKIEFLPHLTTSALEESLIKKRGAYPALSAEEILNGLVHSRIGQKIVRGLNLHTKPLSKVTDGEISSLVKAVKDFRLKITGTGGFDNAQVTRGGIETCGVDPITMESKYQKGLYFCGEILDIDGDCGGYNLQWAYSSAICVLEAIKNG